MTLDFLLKGLIVEKNMIKDIHSSPCIAEPSRLKYTAKLDKNLVDVMPVLFLSTLNSQITKTPVILSFTTQQHNFMIGENGTLAVTYVKDKEEITYINEKIIELINKAIKFRLSNRRNYDALVEKKKKLTPLLLYDLFPKTDCRECGEDSCFNYVAKIFTGEASYDACPYVETKSVLKMVAPVDLGWSLNIQVRATQ